MSSDGLIRGPRKPQIASGKRVAASAQCNPAIANAWTSLVRAFGSFSSSLDSKYFLGYHDFRNRPLPDQRHWSIKPVNANARSDKIARKKVCDSSCNPVVVCLLGLDQAGKSTVLMRLKGESGIAPNASWGFTTQKFNVKPGAGIGSSRRHKRVPETQAVLYDVGGSAKIRNIWQNYLAESHACVFVIDGSSPTRFAEASDALHKIYLDPRMQGKPLAILVNKQDITHPLLSIDVVVVRLNLMALTDATSRHDSQEPDPPILKLVGNAGILGNAILIQPCSSVLPHQSNLSMLRRSCDPGIRTALLWILERIHATLPLLSTRIQSDLAEQRIVWNREKEEQRKRVAAFRNKGQQEEAGVVAMNTTTNGSDEVIETEKIQSSVVGKMDKAVLQQPGGTITETLTTGLVDIVLNHRHGPVPPLELVSYSQCTVETTTPKPLDTFSVEPDIALSQPIESDTATLSISFTPIPVITNSPAKSPMVVPKPKKQATSKKPRPSSAPSRKSSKSSVAHSPHVQQQHPYHPHQPHSTNLTPPPPAPKRNNKSQDSMLTVKASPTLPPTPASATAPIIPISLAASAMARKNLLPPIGQKGMASAAEAASGAVREGKELEVRDSAVCIVEPV
ncbi:hypothetical protein BC830DRAFT_1104445 [Chytriomyces sp. MP71]|nr:hypothetical protein BC830DRAFT_1104445 [Chytriomyces sp. MP71]